jgi:hypothetical protein
MASSEHFSDAELCCHHTVRTVDTNGIPTFSPCNKLGATQELVDALEQLRLIVDRPILVNSAYRCPQHPLTLARPDSMHAKGKAADIRVQGMTARELYREAQQVGAFHGFGVDDHRNYLHVDVRPSSLGRISRWIYGLDGQTLPWDA